MARTEQVRVRAVGGALSEGLGQVRVNRLLPEAKCDRMTAPKGAHVLNPRICDYVTLHVKRDSADVIKDLEMGSWS